MTYEDIRKFMLVKRPDGHEVQINFKTRKSFKGIFLQQPDYEELSRKNLWRIVSETYIPAYKNNGDVNLAKIFNGAEFTRLELL